MPLFLEANFASTMQMIGTAQNGMEGFQVSKIEEVGENMMEDLKIYSKKFMKKNLNQNLMKLELHMNTD